MQGLEKMTGDTVDITEYIDFVFWDLVWFGDDLEDSPVLGQWLGLSHCVESALCCNVLKSNGKIESRRRVQHVTHDGLAKRDTTEHVRLFDVALTERLKDNTFVIAEGEALIYEDENLEEYKNDNTNFLEPSPKNMNNAVERDDCHDDAYDQLL